MPARIVDGEALWRSDKLAQVEPPEFRAEYANMIPLALADGTFECNPRRVWADVYSYNRQDVNVETVEAILDEFERVGLLSRKSDEKGKVWGFWIGIEKRLPSESTRDRYKKGIGSVFNGLERVTTDSRPDHDNIVPRLDLDKNKKGGGHDFKNLAVRYRKTFHVSLSHGSIQKKDYADACAKFGEDVILEKFESWAPENMWIKERKHTNGLRQFYEALPSMIEADAAIEEEAVTQKHQEDSVKEIERQILAKAEADSRQRTETFNAEQAELDRAAAAQTAMLLGDQG